MRQLVKCNLLLLAGLNLTISSTPIIMMAAPMIGRGILDSSYSLDLYVTQREQSTP